VRAWMDRLLLDIYCQQQFPFQQLFDRHNVRLAVSFRFPDKRRRDDHNYYKVICDAVAAGLRIDDKDIRISTHSIVVDKENPGFTIEITDANDG